MKDNKKGFMPKGMKKLLPETKKETPSKGYTYDPRPEIRVKATELPDIENWEVGQEYNLSVRAKMERYLNEINGDTGKNEKSASLRIVGIGTYDEE
jgi:hypothetical protein